MTQQTLVSYQKASAQIRGYVTWIKILQTTSKSSTEADRGARCPQGLRRSPLQGRRVAEGQQERLAEVHSGHQRLGGS